jgi:translocation and assembly module TamA
MWKCQPLLVRILSLARLFAVLSALGLLATSLARAGGGALEYQVKITGGNNPLNSQFRQVSRLFQDQTHPPPGYAGLEQRVDNDLDTFRKVMLSNGYYDAEITARIASNTRPAEVTLIAKTGPLYTLRRCKISYTATPPSSAPQSCTQIGLKLGQAARAAPILAATSALVFRLHSEGRPAARVVARRAVVNRTNAGMALDFEVDPGAVGKFGKITVSGTARTRPGFLRRIAPWKPGAPYDVRQVHKYRMTLSNLDLFDSILVQPEVKAMGSSGQTPIAVAVHEMPHHTIQLGAKYATDTGPGALLGWEDRNLWGDAQALKLIAQGGTLGQLLSASLTLPDQPGLDQTLAFSAATAHDTTDAYTLSGIRQLSQITTPLGGDWSGKANLGFQAATVNQGGISTGSLLASLGVEAAYDSTGSLLNPSHGARFEVSVMPVAGTQVTRTAFLILKTQASTYQPLNDKLIAAARVKLGTILFAPEFSIPPYLRFYAGGGGSVRGYAYQHVSPRNAAGILIGGRSLAETSVELRYRAWQNIGIVGFVDAGMVSTSPYFASSASPRVGAGMGLRYFTSFGPLRLDIGTPVNPAPGDAPIQLYISLGQAF